MCGGQRAHGTKKNRAVFLSLHRSDGFQAEATSQSGLFFAEGHIWATGRGEEGGTGDVLGFLDAATAAC